MVKQEKYALDSSAFVHLASLDKNYSNIFRLTITLTEKIRPVMLANALYQIAPYFPTIVAGIRKEFFRYVVVPCREMPKVSTDTECLKRMTEKEIKQCAIRVLYKENEISVEIFHAITDGHGGIVFLKCLTAEYLRLIHGTVVRIPEMLEIMKTKKELLTENSYQKYQSGKIANIRNCTAYQGQTKHCRDVLQITSRDFSVSELLQKSHERHVSVTTFVTAAMFKAYLKQKPDKNVCIMVPINLRRKFPSITMRNFSLYALPHIETQRFDCSFQEIVDSTAEQLKVGFSKAVLEGSMKRNEKLQKMLWYRVLPVSIKEKLLRLVAHFYGDKNSSITITNLGEVNFPNEIQAYVRDINILLTPRKISLINCSIISYRETMHINFTGKNNNFQLADDFFDCMEDVMFNDPATNRQ